MSTRWPWRWMQAGLARPGMSGLRGGVVADTIPPLVQSNELASFEEIARLAGWGSPSTSSLGPTGISHRFPFARFDSKSRADLAAEALQERVAESVRNPTSDYSLAEANPRFVVLSEDEMSPAEFISAREKLTRFGDPSRKPVSEEETLARICFLMLRSTLDQIASLQEPVVEQSAGPWEELYSLVTSLRLKGKQKKAVIALVTCR